ncbi:metallophosphoesterase [Aliterella atlantica]|uniref:metallophosphoesterase n=1 Tax=Aliterella atlantica TaxID=1827278 RepID=UPI0005D3470C|nr:metallophosphoesterase [Aliterella atlantica]
MNKNIPSHQQDIYFAAVGDVHGHMYAMLGLLQAWESRDRQKLAFVLQVGDFEPHRQQADLATMDAPNRYRKLGEFSDFYSKKAEFPWQIYFIGGNHEPYGFLDLMPAGGEVTKNCYYLGRVGFCELAGLKIVGLSGIYRENLFLHTARPDIAQIGSRSNKDYIGFIQSDIDRALDFQSADILMLHEWSTDTIAADDIESFQQWLPSLKYEVLGNEYARMLIEFLQPKLVLCGHMHKSYRNQVSFSPGTVTDICCLANVQQGKDAIAIFKLAPDGTIVEVSN